MPKSTSNLSNIVRKAVNCMTRSTDGMQSKTTWPARLCNVAKQSRHIHYKSGTNNHVLTWSIGQFSSSILMKGRGTISLPLFQKEQVMTVRYFRTSNSSYHRAINVSKMMN